LGKLRVLSGQEVCAIHQRHGFAQVRRQSSHIVMQRSAEGTTITVPVPDHDEVKVGTLRSIIR
jgi:predicted RNA binding protein YcfA (HicA-like mRNA interferase family)